MTLEEQFGRLVKIARLVKEQPGEWDVPGLAVELGVSESTIHRDIHVLKNYGEVRKARGRGYVIGSFELPLERLSLEEAIALSIGGGILARQAGSPFAEAVRSALRKIGEHLPEDLEESLSRVEGRFSVALPVNRDYSGHGGIFEALNRAILHHHPVEITYFTMGRQSLSERKVDPYSIAFRRNSWYLIGFCHLRGEVRTFGIHRIRQAQVVTGERFRLPKGFSADQYLEGSWQLIPDGPPRKVAVRFDAEVAPWVMEGKWHATQRLAVQPDGGVVFEAEVSGISEIKRWVLSYGGAAEVLEPVELREAVARDVEALAGRYRMGLGF